MNENELTKFINKVDTFTKKPEEYLSYQHEEADKIKFLTKELYGFSKAKEYSTCSNETLNELVVSNMDEEQIWQQLELQNNSVFNNLLSSVANLLAKKNDLNFPLKQTENLKSKKCASKTIDKNRNEQKNCNRNELKSEQNNVKQKNNVNVLKYPVKSSVVDDRFFKLHEMEDFLEKMEKQKEKGYSNGNRSNEDGSDNENEDEIDYFFDDSSADDVENQPKYSDFFDEPFDDVNSYSKRNASSSDVDSREKKKVKFALNDKKNNFPHVNNEESDNDEIENEGNKNFDFDSDDEDLFERITDENEVENFDVKNEDHDNINDVKNKSEIQENKSMQPSTFETRQKRIKAHIDKLEENALKEKPWQMKGEIRADSRPQNSLLEEYVEFDVATRPAPVITEKSTLRLEDIIKQRIKDKAWDDVVRKIKPVEGEAEYRKTLVLDQEKSKLSLAQIYEQEYLKQVENKATENIIEKPEVELAEHQEIRGLMNNLFRKLDALSNFHFTPQPVSAEVKIVSNLPAITMEEVVPVAISDAALLAPEEVKAPQRGDLIGKSERTATDKKRERRKKKLAQKNKYRKIEEKTKEKLENQANGKNAQNKKLSNKLLQKITKSSNVTSLEKTDGKYIRSSSAFFSKLQDETSAKIKKKTIELGKLGKKSKKALPN